MIRRISGALLILLGALGLALSALGVVYVWRAAEDISIAADEGLLLVSDTLKDLNRSIGVASSTLNGATVAIDGLYTTTLDVSRTLSSTRMTVVEMAGLAEDDLPQSVEASLVALEALEETAGVIDQLLRTLQELGLGGYDPQIPLDQAVADATAGLALVPESLRTMGTGLRQTGMSLQEVQEGIAVMGEHMLGIRQNAVEADEALSSHQNTLQQLRRRVGTIRQNVDRPIQTVAWGATLLLIWIGLSQLAIVRWGIDVWQRPTLRPDDHQDSTPAAEASA
jgi:hypothetical protein